MITTISNSFKMSALKYLRCVLVASFLYYAGADDQVCPDNGLSYLPHYSNCSEFFECDDGIKTVMSCPDQYIWSYWAKTCVYHDYIDCFYTTLTPPATTPNPNPGECPTSGESYLPNDDDCTLFYVCNEGQKTSRQCFDGYAWNPQLSACDLIENVYCGPTTYNPDKTTTSTTPTTPNTGTTTTETTVSTTSTPTTPTPEPDPLCKGQKNGAYVAHPYDCTKFIQCVNGQANVLDCPAGESWEQAKKQCNDNNDENCRNSTVIPTTTTTTTTFVTTTPPPTTTPPNDWCVGYKNGALLPHPYDCTKFLECMDEKAMALNCPDGTSWDNAKKACDDNNDVNCRNSTVKPTPTTTTTTTVTTTVPPTTTPPNTWCVGHPNGAFLPHPYDCTKFLECMNEKAIALDCSDGQTWNQQKKMCDDNNEENCKYTSTTAATIRGNLCRGKPNGTLMPHPLDCTKYIFCESNIDITNTCISGTFWNQAAKTCDSKLSDCGVVQN